MAAEDFAEARKIDVHKRNRYHADISSDEDEPKSKASKLHIEYNLEKNYSYQWDASVTAISQSGQRVFNTASSPGDSAYDQSPAVYSPGTNTGHPLRPPPSAGYISGNEPETPDEKWIKGPTEVKQFQTSSSCEIIRQILQRNFVKFKDELVPCGVADQLFVDGIISERDIEKIREANSRRTKCDVLIKSIDTNVKLKSDANLHQKVWSAFEKEGYGNLFNTVTNKDNHGTGIVYSKQDIICRLQEHGDTLIENIDPKTFLDDLVVSGVLSFTDHSYIHETVHRPEAVNNLLKYVLRKPEEFFYPFCKALETQYPEYNSLLLSKLHTSGTREDKWILTAEVKETSTTYYQENTDGNKSTRLTFSFPGDNRVVEKMIVDENISIPNERVVEEAMDVAGFQISGIHFSSVRIDLGSLSSQSQLRFLQRYYESPSCLQEWLQCAIPQKSLEHLAMSGAKTVSIEVHAKWPDISKLSCRCSLKKEAIVKNFTNMERELKDVETFINTFKEYPAFDESTRKYFANTVKSSSTGCTNNESFLRKVLDCKIADGINPEGNAIYLCLLEKLLRETGQTKLLEMLLAPEQQTQGQKKKIKPKHIRHSMTYLLDEIDPKTFSDELRSLPDTEPLLDVIVSKDRRIHRCRQFLEFIIKVGQSATDWFIGALHKKNMTQVLELIRSAVTESRQEDDGYLREGIIAHYTSIVEEVDPRVLRPVFLERKEIRAKTFDSILKHASRRTRVIWLLKHILNSQQSVQRCFVDALQIMGYEQIADKIRKDKEQYRECPRLSKILQNGNEVTIRGEFGISMRKLETEESAFQVYLHKLLYSSYHHEVVNKEERTRQWVEASDANSMCEHPCKLDESEDQSETQSDLHPHHPSSDPRQPDLDESLTDAACTADEQHCQVDGYCSTCNVESPSNSVEPHINVESPSNSLEPHIQQYENISPPSSPLRDDNKGQFTPYETNDNLMNRKFLRSVSYSGNSNDSAVCIPPRKSHSFSPQNFKRIKEKIPAQLNETEYLTYRNTFGKQI